MANKIYSIKVKNSEGNNRWQFYALDDNTFEQNQAPSILFDNELSNLEEIFRKGMDFLKKIGGEGIEIEKEN